MESFDGSAVGPCELCVQAAYEALYSKNGYWIVRCRNCGVVFAHPRPSAEDLQPAYTTGEVGAGAPKGDPCEYQAYAYRFRPFLDLVRAYGRPGRILDAGCWNGQFLSELGPEWEKYGVELSMSASEFARRHYGLNVTTGTVHDAPFRDGFFNAVTMWDVIEHVPNPRRDLRKAADLLAIGGTIFISTPDFDSLEGRILGRNWPVVTPPGHLFYFTERTITRLFQLAGLEVVYWRRTEIPQYLPKLEVPRVGSLVHNRFTEFVTKRFGITLGPTMKVVGRKGREA